MTRVRGLRVDFTAGTNDLDRSSSSAPLKTSRAAAAAAASLRINCYVLNSRSPGLSLAPSGDPAREPARRPRRRGQFLRARPWPRNRPAVERGVLAGGRRSGRSALPRVAPRRCGRAVPVNGDTGGRSGEGAQVPPRGRARGPGSAGPGRGRLDPPLGGRYRTSCSPVTSPLPRDTDGGAAGPADGWSRVPRCPRPLRISGFGEDRGRRRDRAPVPPAPQSRRGARGRRLLPRTDGLCGCRLCPGPAPGCSC